MFGYVYSRWTDTWLEVKFKGTGVSWMGPKQPGYGKAEVYLDGVSQGLVDQYASGAGAGLYETVWTSPALTDTTHTLKIRVTGTKNAASSGVTIVADYFAVQHIAPVAVKSRLNEQTDNALTNGWIKDANKAYFGGGYIYAYKTTAYYSAPFYGTKVAWIGPKTTNYGKAKVYIDGVYVTTVDQYGPTVWRQQIWESGTYARGWHSIRIVPTGTMQAASTGAIVVIDALDVTP
jgi:bacillopeptidase F